MPAGPLPHCNSYFTGRVQMGEGWLQVWCYLYRGAITSDMHAGFIYSDTCICSASPSGKVIWSVKNPSDMPTGKVSLLLVSYHPGRHLEYIKF